LPDMATHAPDARVADAWRAAACLAVDPAGLGGGVVRGDPGEECERWLEALQALLPPGENLRRVPTHIDEERLVGGIDLPASLRRGRTIHACGVLEELTGGFLLVPMAERASPRDCRVSARCWTAARVWIIALDGGRGEEERCAPSLLERLACIWICAECGCMRPATNYPRLRMSLRHARGSALSTSISK